MSTVTVGRTVLYVLSKYDAEAINGRRAAGENHSLAGGAQQHIGNYHNEGDVVPLTVVRVWPDEFGPGIPGINGQAVLDGNDSLWVTSVKEGTETGTWRWPSRLDPAAELIRATLVANVTTPEAGLAATA
ncbi:MAG: hypothetical protein JWQ87_2032 [Candidatus Sulfotelmatobacter sp.]|nr:hypothetical protein [Candidatus Sulfotelmatobacter sp.]